MTRSVLDADPACPGAGNTGADPVETASPTPDPGRTRLRAERRAFGSIDPATWDRLAAANPWASPFSLWAFQQAWWDGYGGTAHDQTVVLVPVDAPADAEPVAIAPLMHRHEVEPGDIETQTRIRGDGRRLLTPVSPQAKAIFFGASYHADYATLLGAPDDLPAVADAVAEHLATPPPVDDRHPLPWDVVDLRRLRCGDPAADALAAAFGRREIDEGWTLNVEREDVCPVVTFPDGIDFDGYLGTLGKKERHEIRRKLRRAEAVGDIELVESPDPLADLETFIDLHQKRWAEAGLFPPTPGGDASRRYFRRLFELAGSGPGAPVRLSFLCVGPRRIGAGVHIETPDGFLYYNAGIDPEARELSPGVLLVARFVARALEEGKRRFDFLRGDEPYKYEWGALDEPIQRLLVRRTTPA